MNFTREEVFEMCNRIAPQFDLDPILVQAICLQESAKNKEGEFTPEVARLEQGFYRRYVEPMSFATTTEILLSASYGIMQMMGLSLMEAGYFKWWFDQKLLRTQRFLGNHLSEISVPKALNEYCINLEWMIEWGCIHFDGKRKKAGGDVHKALDYWNGDMTGKYREEVLQKYRLLKGVK
jgi:hypothetical protein